MSTLSQFSGGGGIKSIQRGTITVTATTATATISAVDTAKTMLNFCGCSSGRVSAGTTTDISVVGRIALTSSTQITANNTVSTSVGNSTITSYEVIEFN
jgi:hypothetical protein